MPATATASAVIPGFPLDPVYGLLGNHARFLRDPVDYLTRTYHEYGALSVIAQGAPGMLFAFGPEFNRMILNQTDVFHSTGLTVPGPFSTSQRRVGYGLFSTNATQNRQRRRLVLPPLQKTAVQSYGDRMARIIDRFLDGWRGRCQLDMLRQMRALSLCVSSQILFGVDLGEGIPAIGASIERWLNMNSSVAVRLSPKDRPSAAYRRMMGFAQDLEREILQLIQRKREQSGLGEDLLSILIRASDERREGMGHGELLGQVAMLLAASYETTADTLNWALFLLAQHPAVLGDLVDELRGVLGGGRPTVAQLGQLELLDRVIKESMRLLPTVVYNSRTNITPAKLGPHRLPKGTIVIFSHYITHRMPQVYPQPARFMPSRWENMHPTPYVYLPFGAGPRMCIGATFATQTIKIALAMILQRYRLTVVPGVRIDRFVRITLTCKRGMPMRVAPQDGRFERSPFRGNLREMIDLGSD